MNADMSRYAVVLCRAGEAGNVGSACRAMKTMGLSRLVLAGCPSYDLDRVATMAVHAVDIYASAERVPDLATALRGFSLSAGFTRRRGERRKSLSVSVRDFASDLAREGRAGSGDIAIVFGNEKDGLSDAELALCSRAVHIPSSDAFPSLNLAQAVQIGCYELFVHALEGKDGSADPVTRVESEAAVADMAGALAPLGFFARAGDGPFRTFFRDLVERAGLGRSELEYLRLTVRKMVALGSGSGNPRRRRAPGGPENGTDGEPRPGSPAGNSGNARDVEPCPGSPAGNPETARDVEPR